MNKKNCKICNIADQLNKRIISLQSPVVVGLDPVLCAIPDVYKKPYLNMADSFEAVGRVFFDFNKDLIDAVVQYTPAVKLQIAFYEKYGVSGLKAFQATVDYARSKGLIVFGDGKRNDVGHTAEAYARGHLGKVELLNGGESPSLNLDWLTVSPFLGKDSLVPFVETCIVNNKGLFILIKTSNSSSADIQDVVNAKGNTISEYMAMYTNEQAQRFVGELGYSPIGAVVGATFPEEAKVLRKIMPSSIFLVPGYGIQGGKASDVVDCFNDDGLGAVINSSRGIMTAWQQKFSSDKVMRDDFMKCAADATRTMRAGIVAALAEKNKSMPDC